MIGPIHGGPHAGLQHRPHARLGRWCARDCDDGAVVVLRGFGLGLDDFSNLLTRSLDVADGVRIVTGTDSSIDILGVSRIGLTADMFGFAREAPAALTLPHAAAIRARPGSAGALNPGRKTPGHPRQEA
jgi:hypothetical protein